MSHKPEQDEMRPEYDFTGGVRGKHHEAYRQGTNVVVLDPEVARVFRDSEAVNRALRLVIKLAGEMAKSWWTVGRGTLQKLPPRLWT